MINGKRFGNRDGFVDVRINSVPASVVDACRRISIVEMESMGAVCRRIFLLGLEVEERRLIERNQFRDRVVEHQESRPLARVK